MWKTKIDAGIAREGVWFKKVNYKQKQKQSNEKEFNSFI